MFYSRETFRSQKKTVIVADLLNSKKELLLADYIGIEKESQESHRTFLDDFNKRRNLIVHSKISDVKKEKELWDSTDYKFFVNVHQQTNELIDAITESLGISRTLKCAFREY